MSDIANLSARIEILERDARLSRAVVAPLVLAAAIFFLLAANAAPQSAAPVRTTELQIVDAAGKTRAWLGVDETGALNLRAMDEDGRMRSVLAVNADGTAGLLLYDDKILRSGLSATGLSFRDSNGNTRVLVGTLEDGTASIIFSDTNGGVRSVVTERVR